MLEFMDYDYLPDGEIDLKIIQKIPANEERALCPHTNIKLPCTIKRKASVQLTSGLGIRKAYIMVAKSVIRLKSTTEGTAMRLRLVSSSKRWQLLMG